MRECLHIFRKDARHLWPYAAALLALRAAATFLIVIESQPTPIVMALAVFLLPLGSCLLLAMALHEDSPCDDDESWITRPHRLASLLGAKALFAVVFINLPFLASDLIWFGHEGVLSPAAVAVALWRQALLVGWSLACAAALACISRTAMQFMFFGLALVFACAGITTVLEQAMPQTEWGPLSCIRNFPQLALFAGAATMTVILQYRRRSLGMARGIFIAGFLAAMAIQALIPWRAAWALASRILPQTPGSAAVSAAFDAARGPAARAELAAFRPRWGGRVRLELPVRFDGLPPGHDVVSDAMNLCVEPEGAPVRCTGWSAIHSLHPSISGYWARFVLFRDFYEGLAHRPARLRVSLALTVYADKERTQVASSGAPMRLSATAFARREEGALVCRSLDPAGRVVAILEEPGGAGASRRHVVVDRINYAPDTEDVHLAPLAIRRGGSIPFSNAARQPFMTVQHPVGRIMREFEARVAGLEQFAFR